MSKKLIPIRIKSLDEDLFHGQVRHLITGKFETLEGDALYDYAFFREDAQPYILLGKEALYEMLPTILREIEKDLHLWLTDNDISKRELAELIVSWKNEEKNKK